MEKETIKYVEDVLSKSKNPTVLCSFGKDSMAMLYLIRKVKKDIPVIFFRQPFFPKKYAFANSVIEDWNLTVYDFPPSYTDVISRDKFVEALNIYKGYGRSFLFLPTGTYPYRDGECYACLRDDFFGRPKVKDYKFKWDTIFVGHKNEDKDSILGITILKERTVPLLEMTMALPMKDWSDDDIWAYIVKNDIPYNKRRYNADNGFKEFDDKTYNNDHHACCFKCLDNNEGPTVLCPRNNTMINNDSLSVEQNVIKLESYLNAAKYMESKR